MQDLCSLQKIVSPALPPTILHREELIRKLHHVIAGIPLTTAGEVFSHKLVLLYAPAGYGKTTLLADFAQRTNFPCCWYFLNNTDTDKITFFQSIIASIRHRFPKFGAALDPLLTAKIATDARKSEGLQGGHSFDEIVDVLTTTIKDEITERFALLLCNYHEINNDQVINGLVNQLVKKLPAQCVLVIESRAIPSLEFASLLAHRQMFGLGSNLLRFTAREIRDLACVQGMAPLSDAEAEELGAFFDGWIAGILLGTHLGDVQFLQESGGIHAHKDAAVLSKDRHHLFAYLVNEVFSREPEVYAFLKEAAILQQMKPSLCADLLNVTDAASRLLYLEQQGLFVTHSGDGAQITYTCHPVLRDLLCDDLRRQSPERFTALHRRAAELFHALRNYTQAVYHALEVHADDLALRLILEAYEPMVAQGHAETLAHWIEALPPTTMSCHPKLLLMRANIYLMLGEQARALPLLESASTTITSLPPTHDTNEMVILHAAISVAHSKALLQTGKYLQAQVLCQQVLTQVPVDEVALRAEAHTLLGACANFLGDFHSGIAQFQQALQLMGRNTQGRHTADLHSTLASSYSLLGNFALAEHHLSRAIKCWDGLHDECGKVNNLIRMGLIKQRQGLFAEAETIFTQALTIARTAIRFQRGEAYALVNMGELYQDQGLYDRSLAATEDGLALAREIGDKYLENCALCILAMTYLLMGDSSTAMLLVSQTDIQTSQECTGAAGYERTMRELTYGTILLYRRSYDEAYASLTASETLLKAIGLKRERLQATLRIATCQLARGRMDEVVQRLEEVATLTMCDDYEELVQMELHRHRALEQALKTIPEATRLRAWLHLETAHSETEASLPPSPVALAPSPIAACTTTKQPKLQIQALGEPTIFLDDVPITHWRLARVLELCFYLLDCGRSMHKEQIITALWSEIDDQIDKKLRTIVYYLRKTLGESCVVFRSGTYTLDLASHYGDNVQYDVAAFQEHYTRGKRALRSEDDATARTAFLEMVDLYRGDYVQSFYSDWCTRRRDELRCAYVDARSHLARIAWRCEQFDESAVHWQHMLAVDNCLEDAHLGLMRCYLRQGKRGSALRQYQHCIEVLKEELGVSPGPNIQNLYQRYIAGNKES